MKPDKIIETFQQHLRRHFAFGFKVKAGKNVETWETRNRGEGRAPSSGRNAMKRSVREARRLDRLAHIRHERANGNAGHVPKLKRVPSHVFE